MKLTTEQKRYRKSVIFDAEIKMLQEKIDNLGLSKPLTIKKLYFDYNKAQSHRSCCVLFKETFTVIHQNLPKNKEKVHKWASANLVFDGSGVKHNGLVISNVFCSGGCRYKDSNNDIEDDDIRKVCNMLANEYFLWIHWTDRHIEMDTDRINRNVEKYPDIYTEDNKWDVCKHFMYVMWKRLDIGFDGVYTQYTLNELIQKYNEQVARGLIIDCPFEDGKFPFDNVDKEELSEKELTEGGLYG